MRGQVLGVDRTSGEGQIAGDDGVRYSFRREDWSDTRSPAIGALVDFEADARRALRIYHLPAATPVAQLLEPAGPQTDRNRLIAALIAFTIGALGIHRFYLGRIGSGIAMLVLSCTLVGLFVTWPWAIVDMIRYLVMSDEEFAARYPR